MPSFTSSAAGPETYWLYVILIGGSLGAIIYIFVEVLPDFGLLRGTLKVFPRRRRIRELEAIVLDNPSAGNYEELADLYLEEGKYQRARDCYNKAISSAPTRPDPFYRRGLAEIELGDFTAALPDLERVIRKDPKYDFTGPPGCWPTPTRSLDSQRKLTRYSKKPSRFRRFLRPI